jgi:hypothetical protein
MHEIQSNFQKAFAAGFSAPDTHHLRKIARTGDKIGANPTITVRVLSHFAHHPQLVPWLRRATTCRA